MDSKEKLSHSFKGCNSLFNLNHINGNKIKEEDIKRNNFEEKEYFRNYLESDIDDQDFDDIILEDKRRFQEYFCDSLKEKQIFVNTFCNYDPFRPISIKIILLILNLVMYMVVNGLFYGEEVISQIYHIEGEESFFGYFPRSIIRFLYSTIVGVVIGYIIDCFFIDEKKMKKIFIREKENITNLKTQIVNLNKKIKKNYIGFIISVFVLLLLFGIYLLCFNYAYRHTQYEWIKSSITLIIIVQVLSILAALIETILRFIALNFRNERIFKISKLFD